MSFAKKFSPVALLLIFLPLALFSQSFTLQEIMSNPYPSGLISAENADRVAWIQNDEGVRNIWTASDYTPVKLTGYTEDDGQPLSSLKLSPDGSFLLYIRGGSPNRLGEHPNPTSNPERAEQAIWMVDTDGNSRPRKIAGGNNPVLSPDARTLLFQRGKIHKISLPSAPGDSIGQPEKLFDIRGSNGSPAWSPDGSRIAFTSNRGGHSFIGVYHLQENRIRWTTGDRLLFYSEHEGWLKTFDTAADFFDRKLK